MNVSAVNLHIKPIPANVEVLAVSDTAAGVQLTTTGWNGNTEYIVVQVRGDAVYYTVSGEAPTSSNGFYMAAGTIAEWSRQWAAAAKFIRVTSDATVIAQEAGR